ncbi:hypothetical protein Clacol_006942 [Clathrus columnatus]|uniref:Uncharacterized protein n=1 Tax=Clathrus columnatus TaxID=1419009 RepID=A0AAV5AHV9_9AGAM|nr:hypothetical protein Clacol_006942 [Clathrus columnatus]
MIYVSGIHIRYYSIPDAIEDINGGSSNVNEGNPVSKVQLAAEYTLDPKEACNRFKVVIQDVANPVIDNYAGDQGSFRYILPFCNPADATKITEVRLLRSTQAVEVPPSGYTGMTTNLNHGRKGGFLYLIWESVVMENNLQSQYISGYSVLYGVRASQEPRNAVTTLDDNGDDINQDFGGKHVWIVPQYTGKIEDAKTGFVSVVQSTINPQYENLGSGSGGDYRYLLGMLDLGTKYRIKNIRLLRSSSKVTSPPNGYDGITDDINKGRTGTYLYLTWTAVYAPVFTFVSEIQVRYGHVPSQEPLGTATVLGNGSDDVNFGFGSE